MKAVEFAKQLLEGFNIAGVKGEIEYAIDGDIEDSIDYDYRIAITGGDFPDVLYMYIPDNPISILTKTNTVILKLDNQWDFDKFIIALAHVGWMKAAMKINIIYTCGMYAYHMMNGMIESAIELNDPIALQNIVNFDIDEFVDYHNGTFNDNMMHLLVDKSAAKCSIGDVFAQQASWSIFRDVAFDSYLEFCDRYNAIECKAILLKWKESFPDKEEDMSI